MPQNKVILFQGDSVTDCDRNRAVSHSLGNGYPHDIASALSYRDPDKGYTFLNRGVSGDRVVSLLARWKADCLNLKPDVLSVLIGINDVWHEFNTQTGVTADKFERYYSLLLADTLEALPRVNLILCDPFFTAAGQPGSELERWTAELAVRRAIVAKLAVKYRALHIPLQRYFDEACQLAPPAHWAGDGVHPTLAGHMLIAEKWLAAAGKSGMLR